MTDSQKVVGNGDPPTGQGRLAVVAGASGNAGHGIVRGLAAQGFRVRALARTPERLADVRVLCDEIQTVDVVGDASLSGALAGADVFVSALGKTYQRDAVRRRRVDVDANLRLFQTARDHGVSQIGLVSVIGADPQEAAPMLRMKAETEAGLRALGLPCVILRPTGFFTDMWLLYRIARWRVMPWLRGVEITFNPIHPDDLGAFMAGRLAAGPASAETIAVGGPEVWNSETLRALFSHLLDHWVMPATLPRWTVGLAAAMVKPFDLDLWEGLASIQTIDGYRDLTGRAVGRRRLAPYLRARDATRCAGTVL